MSDGRRGQMIGLTVRLHWPDRIGRFSNVAGIDALTPCAPAVAAPPSQAVNFAAGIAGGGPAGEAAVRT